MRKFKVSVLLCFALIFTMSFCVYGAADENNAVLSGSSINNESEKTGKGQEEGKDQEEGKNPEEGQESEADKDSDKNKNPENAAEPENTSNSGNNAAGGAGNVPVLTAVQSAPVMRTKGNTNVTGPNQQVIDGKKYMIYSDGSHYKGWYDLTSEWRVYCDPDDNGAMITGSVKEISGNQYLFNEDGILIRGSGTPVVNGAKYWVSDGIVMSGWLNLAGSRLYFDAAAGYKAKTGLAAVEGKKYLFRADGVRYDEQGTPVIDGKKYWFAEDSSLRTGWLYFSGFKMYFDPNDCAAKTSLSQIEGKHYIFDKNGTMPSVSGTPVVDNEKYWVNPDGVLNSGWLKFNGWQMYFDPVTFTARTSLCEIEGNHYIFDKNGTMPSISGTPVIGNEKYWINPNGTLNSGWLILSGWQMYFDPVTFTAKKGLVSIGDKHYIFNDDGVSLAAAGTPIINGKKYCFNSDGSLRSGWITFNGWQMYFDPTTFQGASGVSSIEGKYYVFDGNGILLTGNGTQVINGKKYYFNPDGSIQIGWVTLGNWKMYFEPSTGAAATGVYKIEGKLYAFDQNGIWLTGSGTQVINGKKYCFNSDGSVQVGWVTLGSWKFYFDPSTGEARTGFSVISGNTYYFDSNGVMAVGPVVISSTYYYFNDNGTMVKNAWRIVNGQNMYFDSQGKGGNNYSGAYLLKVDRTNCVVTAYGQDNNGNFTIPIKSMLCSVGLPATPTPSGTFRTSAKFKLKELMGPSWGKWATRVTDGIYFHSVATGSASDPTHTVPPAEFNKLGQPASHGCIRLCVRDAKWIYDNCSLGTTVQIGNNFSLPFGIPTLPKISGGVDPTDPEA